MELTSYIGLCVIVYLCVIYVLPETSVAISVFCVVSEISPQFVKNCEVISDFQMRVTSLECQYCMCICI